MPNLTINQAQREPERIEPAVRQFLTFRLGGEQFAIGIEPIREIIEFNGLTEIPMMPPHMRGVINLRGAVVPVIDLAARFGRGQTAFCRRSCIVVIEVEVD
ncbi:MAG: purine-binding chemotaxis protein CheW, partial [Burkholderiaceae bacterium]|nr:purine-binding chemotaxis protein CheW [Burkholderiaceae bacterium]